MPKITEKILRKKKKKKLKILRKRWCRWCKENRWPLNKTIDAITTYIITYEWQDLLTVPQLHRSIYQNLSVQIHSGANVPTNHIYVISHRRRSEKNDSQPSAFPLVWHIRLKKFEYIKYTRSPGFPCVSIYTVVRLCSSF